jgi:hypothetical protein
VLLSPEEEKEADETVKQTGGKIDDEKLLAMADEGKPQTEIAKFFSVSKQAINKRLKFLKKDAA